MTREPSLTPFSAAWISALGSILLLTIAGLFHAIGLEPLLAGLAASAVAAVVAFLAYQSAWARHDRARREELLREEAPRK